MNKLPSVFAAKSFAAAALVMTLAASALARAAAPAHADKPQGAAAPAPAAVPAPAPGAAASPAAGAKNAPAPAAAAVPATALDPVGDWFTINDESKKATSVVRIGWEAGALVGRVQKVLTSNRGPNPLCERCDGERRGKPIVGMDVLWGLHGKDGAYEGGYVLDPSKGKQYRAKIKMRSPDVLELRGFIGFAAFGRTQVWQRVAQGTAVPEVK